MKIENSNQVHTSNVTTNQKSVQSASTNTAAAARAVDSTQSSGVAVTVSTLARGLEKAARSDAAVIDTQKVASVRSAIQKGTYVVNPEAIADKLLSNAQEMLKGATE
jgi:negative regulator of flagellin synthesis FlgM